MSCAPTRYGTHDMRRTLVSIVFRAVALLVRTFDSMIERAVRPAVFEIQKANYGAFTRKMHDEIGRDLSGCSQVRAVWLAAEDAGTRHETRYLQVALLANDHDLDDVAAGLLRSLERRHRVRLALARCAARSDAVPREVVDVLQLDQKWDNPHVSLVRTDWGRLG